MLGYMMRPAFIERDAWQVHHETEARCKTSPWQSRVEIGLRTCLAAWPAGTTPEVLCAILRLDEHLWVGRNRLLK